MKNAKKYSLEEKLEYYQDAIAYLKGDALEFASLRIAQLEEAIRKKDVYKKIREAWDDHHNKGKKKGRR